MFALQGSLLSLDLGDQPCDGIGRFERTMLSNGAWIDICRNWLSEADELFEQLYLCVPWRDERRKMYDRVVDVPRRMCFYDKDEALPNQRLVVARQDLTKHYRSEKGSTLCSVGLCLYRDGKDSVAWHGDRIGRGAKSDVVIAIISLGAMRTMAIRPRSGGASQRFDLKSGDLFVMGGSCQRYFEHCIPKTTREVGARVSVQFRPAGVR